MRYFGFSVRLIGIRDDPLSLQQRLIQPSRSIKFHALKGMHMIKKNKRILAFITKLAYE